MIGPIGGKIKQLVAGELDSGETRAINSTSEGHLEVAIHGPRLPFGSLHTERLTPVFQSDGVYGPNESIVRSSTGLSVGTGAGSGTVDSTGNMLRCQTGTTQYSFATLQSRRRLRYRAGQGVILRFAGLFEDPVASMILVAGCGTAESGFFFGYNGTSFGILHSTGGVREVHTLTITTASTATNDYVVTLPNTATVNVTATNNGSTTQTAYEISLGTFPGWEAYASGSTVVFVAASSGPVSGSFSLAQPSAGTPAAGTDAETIAGVAATDTWIAQASWNGDVLDGTGSASNPSGATIDPTKGNVYEIGIQYLGFGSVEFRIEVASAGNNPNYVTVHTLRFPNALTAPHSSQPSFPFTMAAYSAGSTTNGVVKIGSFAGFIEGEPRNLGPRISYDRETTVTSSTSAYTPILTVKNSLLFGGRVNQSVSKLIDMSGSVKGNANAHTKFYLVRNAQLTGPVNFQSVSTSSSCLLDVAATGMAAPDRDQFIWVDSIVESGQFDHVFADAENTLQPGESWTIAVRSISATGACTATLNTREDQ